MEIPAVPQVGGKLEPLSDIDIFYKLITSPQVSEEDSIVK